jgi:hypothetical protein
LANADFSFLRSYYKPPLPRFYRVVFCFNF